MDRKSIPNTVLIDSNGEPYSLQSGNHDVVVVAFIFTTCYDVCPLITSNLVAAQRQLEDIDYQFISVTVDPAKDTPEALSHYKENFGADWPHLTGNISQLEAVWDDFQISVLTEEIETEESGSSPEHQEIISTEFPVFITDAFTFTAWVNQGEDYLKEHYRWITRLIASYVKEGYFMLEDFLLDSSWLFVTALLLIPSLAFGGLRLGILVLFGTMYWGMVGLWDSAMETLALMGLSVLLSVIVGIILGIFCSLSDRFERGMKPVLDIMQVMPAFVYLIPAMFFFGIGGAPAILATMIYSMPPIIRLTNLGIRQVPNETIETATAFGSTRSQVLFKVQIPLALPSIMMGVNQTIMMALALVVLATFIGAQGLGSDIWVSIKKLEVGAALDGGFCVLLMAIMFDRFGKAASRETVTLPVDSQKFYLLPQTWDIYPTARYIEKPLQFIHLAVAFIFSSIIIEILLFS